MEGEALELTPRERFFRAVEHKEIDRVPIDFGGAAESSVACSIIDAPPYGYRALCKYLGITDYAPPEVSFILRSVTNVDERILKKFNVDFRDVPPPDHSKFKPEVLPNGYVRGEHGILWKPGYATGGYICVPDHETPFRYGKTIKDVEEYPYWSKVNVPQLEKYASELYKKAKELHENTDYVIRDFTRRVCRSVVYDYDFKLIFRISKLSHPFKNLPYHELLVMSRYQNSNFRRVNADYSFK